MRILILVFNLLIYNVFANYECKIEIQDANSLLTFQNGTTVTSLKKLEHNQSFKLFCRNGTFIDPETSQNQITLSCDNGNLQIDGKVGQIPKCQQTTCSNVFTAMQNIKETPSKPLQVGEQFVFRCLDNYAILMNGEYRQSIKAKCEPNGQLKPIDINAFQECNKVCDISRVILNNNIDIAKSTFTTGLGSPQPLQSSIINLKSVLQLQCKENFSFYLKDDIGNNIVDQSGNFITGSSYQYNCDPSDKKNKKIYSCVPKRLTPISSKAIPHSNVGNNTVIPLSCFAKSIITSNNKIQISGGGSNIKNRYENGETLKLKCNKGFGTQDKQKEFNVTCNGNSGYWDGNKPCLASCDAKYLASITGNVGSMFIINSNDGSTSKPLNDLVRKGEKLEVICAPGYEIRNTGKNYYETTCVDGKNFSIGVKVPKCEKKIPQCNNSDIQITGFLKDYTNLYARTNAGGLLPFVCNGDDDQKGDYFKNGGNSGGVDGVPVCQFNEASGESNWSHKSFKCFDGCITPDFSLETHKDIYINNFGYTYQYYEETGSVRNNGFNIGKVSYNPYIHNTDYPANCLIGESELKQLSQPGFKLQNWEDNNMIKIIRCPNTQNNQGSQENFATQTIELLTFNISACLGQNNIRKYPVLTTAALYSYVTTARGATYKTDARFAIPSKQGYFGGKRNELYEQYCVKDRVKYKDGLVKILSKKNNTKERIQASYQGKKDVPEFLFKYIMQVDTNNTSKIINDNMNHFRIHCAGNVLYAKGKGGWSADGQTRDREYYKEDYKAYVGYQNATYKKIWEQSSTIKRQE